MEPLKRIDENTPIGARVVVIVEGSELNIGTYEGTRCGWAHVGKGFSQTLHSTLYVFELPEAQP